MACSRFGVLFLLVSFVCALLPATTRAQTVPAFPGADGAAWDVTGGRGGVVYHVTRLDSKLGDNGVGTFQYGINDSNFAAGPRTIVFDVGGTVWLGLKTTDTNGWDTQNSVNIGTNVTIAGQTAPGGIALMGAQLKINGATQAGSTLPVANTIVRNVTMAAGYGLRKANSTSGYYDNYTYDNMDINSKGVMVDHVTALYASDESISANELADHVTVQYSTIAQGQSYPQADAQGGGAYKAHALGDLWGLGSNAVSTFSHNLYANISGRIPTIQTSSSKLSNNVPAYTDFRNNVVYNWFGTAGYGSSGSPGAGEFEGNYYKVGPGGDGATGNATDFSIVATSGGTTVFSNSSSTPVYQTGNVRSNRNGTTTNLVNSDFGSGTFQSSPYTQIPYRGVTDSAANAYNQVLNYVGANWQNRSLIDQRLVNETRTGTGKIAALDDINNGFDSAGAYIFNGINPTNPTNTADLEWNRLLGLRSATNGGAGATGSLIRSAGYDTDQDGMPDVWEMAIGLSPSVADNNGSIMRDGYTNLEAYLNEVAAWPASAPLVFNNGNGTSRYAEIGNWQTGVYKPTRFDTVQVNTGTSIVDVPGQHAKALFIATSRGNAGSLSVTAGWLDVPQNIFVGPGGAGSVSQSGGAVRAGTAVILGGSTGTGIYTITDGILATPLLTKSGQGGTFSLLGGILHADTIAFDFTNQGGTLAPGSDETLEAIALASMPDINGQVEQSLSRVGMTHVMGNLVLQSGTLEMDFASLSSFDTVNVDSALTLGGSLSVNLLDGYAPNAGDEFLIGTASSISGSFASVTPGFSVLVSDGNLLLVAVPEPSSCVLFATAAAIALAVASLRRKHSAG
jgi:hypothetical protein